MKDIRLVTFDCYGTLIDWETGISDVVARIAKEKKVSTATEKLVSRYIELEFSLEQSGEFLPYAEVLAMGLRLLFAEKNVYLEAPDCVRLARSLPAWKPFPETKRVLRRLKDAGYRIGVLSNVDDALLSKSLKKIGVRFDYRVTSQKVKSYKPRTAHWQKALSLSKLAKKNVLHVAASQIHDIIPAKTLGWRCAWINRRGARRGAGARADHVFPDLRPLPELLPLSRGRGIRRALRPRKA